MYRACIVVQLGRQSSVVSRHPRGSYIRPVNLWCLFLFFFSPRSTPHPPPHDPEIIIKIEIKQNALVGWFFFFSHPLKYVLAMYDPVGGRWWWFSARPGPRARSSGSGLSDKNRWYIHTKVYYINATRQQNENHP